jgi:serine/threonine protein kinase
MEQRRDEQPMTIDPARLAVSEELLGEGSYGRVVAGTLTTGRRTLRVAVKTLPAMTREQERQAFRDEFKKHMHAARHCQGVCLLYGLCEVQQSRLCIVMKRYERSLESAIAAAGATGLDEERVRRYAESLSRTLQELHESGLVLRDIKPPNILLDAYDQPVFADFGIALFLQTTVHRGTSIAGTWNYMAPEAFEPQAFAEGIGKHTDVWGLACVIVEMHTGQRPWADMQMQQISRAVCDQQRTPQVPEDAPAAALLRRCFERRPTQRPTAANLADAFAGDVREGVEGPSPTLPRRLADQEAITEEVTRVNSRLTQDNARLQREVEALGDVRRQERALQGNVQQLTQENARLAQQHCTAKWRRGSVVELESQDCCVDRAGNVCRD